MLVENKPFQVAVRLWLGWSYFHANTVNGCLGTQAADSFHEHSLTQTKLNPFHDTLNTVPLMM